MHEVSFASANTPDRVFILGLRMRRFSIGHEIALWAQKNPLVTYTPEGFDELPVAEKNLAILRAVLICYRNWTGCFLPEKWLALFSWRLRGRPVGIWKFKIRLTGAVDFSKAIAEFREYRLAGSNDFPTVKIPRESRSQFHYFGAPEVARLLLFLGKDEFHYALGFESPYDVPLNLARMLYLADAEAEGNVWVENFQDRQNAEGKKRFEDNQKGSGVKIDGKEVPRA